MIALPNCQEAVVPWICGPNFVTFSGHQVEHFLFLQGLIESRKDSLWKSQVVTVGLGFPSGSDSKESTCNLGDSGLIPGLGRSPGGGHGNPLQCSCLENPHGQRSLVVCSPWGHKDSDAAPLFSLKKSLGPAEGGGKGRFRALWYSHRLQDMSSICYSKIPQDKRSKMISGWEWGDRLGNSLLMILLKKCIPMHLVLQKSVFRVKPAVFNNPYDHPVWSLTILRTLIKERVVFGKIILENYLTSGKVSKISTIYFSMAWVGKI